mmetsp:Transcript_98573/g.174617  ORF Transcript_98573/g.174617 Transcript_98573/m.174617 type:complete len:260 (-) Transcript_98573:344-1123(-)
MVGHQSLSQKLRDAIQAVLPLVKDNLKFESEAVTVFVEFRRVCLQNKNATKKQEIFERQVAHAIPVYRFLIKFTERFHKVRIRQICEVLQCLMTSSPAWGAALESCDELQERLRELPTSVQEKLKQSTALMEWNIPKVSSPFSEVSSPWTQWPEPAHPECEPERRPDNPRKTSAKSATPSAASSVTKKYMWMWGDRNFIATFNPIRWSEYQSAASMAGEFEQIDSKHTSRPIKIKDKGSGDWRFSTVPEAIDFLRGASE